jgi:hypothetical protein
MVRDTVSRVVLLANREQIVCKGHRHDSDQRSYRIDFLHLHIDCFLTMRTDHVCYNKAITTLFTIAVYEIDALLESGQIPNRPFTSDRHKPSVSGES